MAIQLWLVVDAMLDWKPRIVLPTERKRASQARRGLIDELVYGDVDEEQSDRERWQG